MVSLGMNCFYWFGAIGRVGGLTFCRASDAP
jgi:hypothetical protein